MLSDITLVRSYREAARRPGFNRRKWMRDPDTVAFLENYVRTGPIRLVRRDDVESVGSA